MRLKWECEESADSVYHIASTPVGEVQIVAVSRHTPMLSVYFLVNWMVPDAEESCFIGVRDDLDDAKRFAEDYLYELAARFSQLEARYALTDAGRAAMGKK